MNDFSWLQSLLVANKFYTLELKATHFSSKGLLNARVLIFHTESSRLSGTPEPTRRYFAHGGGVPSVPLIAVWTLDKDGAVAQTLRKYLTTDVVQSYSSSCERATERKKLFRLPFVMLSHSIW